MNIRFRKEGDVTRLCRSYRHVKTLVTVAHAYSPNQKQRRKQCGAHLEQETRCHSRDSTIRSDVNSEGGLCLPKIDRSYPMAHVCEQVPNQSYKYAHHLAELHLPAYPQGKYHRCFFERSHAMEDDAM